MLPAAHRLTEAQTFRTVVRTGRRAGSRTLVVHLAQDDAGVTPRAGLVVGRGVGNAVTRNRVQRRLRHLLREQLERLPDSALLVVRALPAAAAASSKELRADLDRCLQRVLSGAAAGRTA